MKLFEKAEVTSPDYSPTVMSFDGAAVVVEERPRASRDDAGAVEGKTARQVKLGILLDGKNQEGWVLEALRQALAVPGVSVTAIAVVNGIHSGSIGSRVHGLFDRVDKMVRCPGERLFARVDIPAEFDVAPLHIDVDRHRAGWCPDEAGLAALRNCAVDAWLSFTATAPRRPMPRVSRLGVWGMEIGQDVPATNNWGGAVEIGAGSPVTMIGVVDYAAAGNGLLYRTYGATITNSVSRNRLNSLHKGISFFRRILQQTHDAATGQPPAPAGYPQMREPTVAAVGRVFSRLASTVAMTRLRSLNWKDQWQLAYYFADTDDAGVRFDRLRYLVPPKDRFWADPFAVEHDGRYFIFFEELLYRTKKGRIMVVEVFENGAAGAPQIALECAYHLSYPFIFEWEGTLYMMPETATNGTLEVYRCEAFPLRWRLERVVLDNISAYDATLWQDGERWWMFVNIAEPGADSSDELHLYWSSTPLGPWTPHRANPIVSDVRRARPAGPVFSRDGMLYRPSQDCSLAYGHSVLVNRVDLLNENEYRETTVQRVSPGWRKDILHVHTFGGTQRLRVVDYLVRRQQRF